MGPELASALSELIDSAIQATIDPSGPVEEAAIAECLRGATDHIAKYFDNGEIPFDLDAVQIPMDLTRHPVDSSSLSVAAPLLSSR